MKKKKMFYKESGKVSPLGLIVSFGICTIVAIVLGYVYSTVSLFIPIVYANFLITFGFGIILGLTVKVLIRLTHNRNRKSYLIQGAFLGILANYFQWTAYVLYAYFGETPSFYEYLSNLHLIVLPDFFFPAIAEIYETGTWSIFGITFNGTILAVIWMFEFMIIVSIPVLAGYYTKPYPYSELLNRWYPKFKLKRDFESIPSASDLLDNLNTNTFDTLQALGLGGGFRFSKIYVFYHKNEERQYLTVERMFVSSQDKKTKEVIINNFTIDNKTAELILDNFDNNKERIDVIQ